jgi:hypothetical protein
LSRDWSSVGGLRPRGLSYRKSLTASALSSPFSVFFWSFLFFETYYSIHSEEWSCSFSLWPFIDNQGSLVIFRSASVRPKHLFGQDFNQDYLFKLPFQGAGCPFKFTVFYCPPFPVPSSPACEPNSNDGEYSRPFRHIQYKRTPSLRPIATFAMFRCRRIAKCR